MKQKTFKTVDYVVEGEVARVRMNRPRVRNAQNLQMTYDLNDVFNLAAQDDSVKAIILSGEGPHFSSGHDLHDIDTPPSEYDVVGTWGGFEIPGAEGWVAREEEIYLGMCERWRNIPKPLIAMVQGKCTTGGLMLIWICDLIIASDDAVFSDRAVNMGVAGVEWFSHPWELGPRKAKEMLWTADWLSAEDGRMLGMVNHVVPRDSLESFTIELAEKIASKPTLAVKLIKEAVNKTMDIQGQTTSMHTAFGLHQLCHAQNEKLYDSPIIWDQVPIERRDAKWRASQNEAADSGNSEPDVPDDLGHLRPS